jgi:two-component system phosphate regulon sensor histidine kinase PhoR
MISKRSKDIESYTNQDNEIVILREENERLRQENRKAYNYIRTKVNDLLKVIGTQSLKPDELDDQTLVDFDPIQIVTQTFQHVLENTRETNRKLHFAHQEIQTVFDTVGVSILVLDVDGKIVTHNQTAKNIMFRVHNDVVGEPCADHICSGQASDDRCVFEVVKNEEREVQFQDWSLNGHNFDVIGKPMFDGSGQLSHVVVSYKDVTARRNAEVALMQSLSETQEANAKLHGLLRSAADAILITDAEERIVLMNKRAEELFGLCMTDHRVMNKIDLLPHKELVTFLKDAAKNEQGFVVKDFVFTDTETGQEHLCQARLSIIDSPQVAYNGCITFLHDVTEEREIERMKSEFVSTAAHELRTPLATIIGYTDLLMMKEDVEEEERQDFLNMIQNKAERLADIVSDLLDISRIESGEGVALDPKPCDLSLLCKEVIENFQYQSERHSFWLDLESHVVVQVDRYAVLQILENLVSNAMKYSPEGGEISISTLKQDCHCSVTVADHGIGMTSAQIEKVFDKFYRVDATNTAISGTGLGMTIVKYLVDAHGGKVEIESTPGRGTRVTICFPCSDQQ